jgi:hypothetical protein
MGNVQTSIQSTLYQNSDQSAAFNELKNSYHFSPTKESLNRWSHRHHTHIAIRCGQSPALIHHLKKGKLHQTTTLGVGFVHTTESYSYFLKKQEETLQFSFQEYSKRF